ncbi:MAG: serine/threonine-protein kinase [Kofleriaceae bacterium]
MLGTSIGFYQITKQLGQGGMGAVYLAEHTRIGSRKVVKVLLPELCQNAQVVHRFENEARASARLDHRNIIKIDDFGQLPSGQWYIMMPLLDGGSLESFLGSHGKLSIHQALPILAQICAALQVAHDAGIVHRDLKPANIFLTATADNPRQVTLLDFGIAKLGEATDGLATQTGAAFGTPMYMPAEQFEDASRADARSDLFSLGVIAYQMVTGSLPFGTAPGPVLYNRQITTRPERPRGVPFEWAELLLRALALRPVDRPESARAFALALAAVTPAEPPFELDGMSILSFVARELVTHAPHDASTVRRSTGDAEVSRIAGELGRAPEPAPSSHVARSAAASPGAPAALSDGPEPAPGALGATTLSALPGQRPASDAGKRTWAWLAVAGAAMLALAVVGASLVMGDASPGSTRATTPPTTAAATVPPVGSAEASPAPATPATAAAAAPGLEPTTTAPDPADHDDAAAPMVTLTVETYPAGASLQLEGRVLGRAPQVLTVREGEPLVFRAEAPGRVPLERAVRPSAASPRVLLRLERAPRPTSARPQGSPPARPPPGPRPFDPDAPGGDS